MDKNWQDLLPPLLVNEPSGILPREDWGTWSPRVTVPRYWRSINQPEKRSVTCYECEQSCDVPMRALSALCPHCRSHMQLVDITVKPTSRRSHINTQGKITISSDCRLSNLRLQCNKLVIKGNIDGLINCRGELVISGSPTLTQPLRAGKLIITSTGRLHAHAAIHADEVIIHGSLEGYVHAKHSLRIAAGGNLQGNCRSPVLSIAPKGNHVGRWEQTKAS